jgi:hypothetical protein
MASALCNRRGLQLVQETSESEEYCRATVQNRTVLLLTCFVLLRCARERRSSVHTEAHKCAPSCPRSYHRPRFVPCASLCVHYEVQATNTSKIIQYVAPLCRNNVSIRLRWSTEFIFSGWISKLASGDFIQPSSLNLAKKFLPSFSPESC